MPPGGSNDTKLGNTTRERALFCIGAFQVLIGLSANQWLLAILFSPDGTIDDPADLTLIWIFQAVMIGWGVANLVFRRRMLAARLNLLMITFCLMSPIVGELGLRAMIASGIQTVRNPGLYADPFSDDDYWKLYKLWQDKATAEVGQFPRDELLGWAPPKSSDNPLGLITDTPYTPRFDERVVLFFGDSFVAGATAMVDKIPQQLETMLDGCPVYNFGVPGYGVDQISLRFRDSHGPFKNPFVLFGILTNNLDRSILTFRGAVKPRFVLGNDGEPLSLENVPVTDEPAQWIADHPLGIRSFLYAFALTRYRLHQPGQWRDIPYMQQHKKHLNAPIIEETVQHARENNLPMLIVLFYDPEEFDTVGWREAFLKEQMKRLSADFIDTKKILLEAAQRDRCSIADFYRPDHHLNARGNRIVAEALAAELAQRRVCKQR